MLVTCMDEMPLSLSAPELWIFWLVGKNNSCQVKDINAV